VIALYRPGVPSNGTPRSRARGTGTCALALAPKKKARSTAANAAAGQSVLFLDGIDLLLSPASNMTTELTLPYS
jgi:hypothetical protein